MSHISFYRKWRPQNFSQVIGQDYVVKTLQNAVSKKRLTHAYMFSGPRGTGKTSMARILSKAINCMDESSPEPCNKCANCISISEGSNVDIIEIDAASNRGIDEMKDIRDKVQYLPTSLKKKIYIIDEVHMITREGFNAFLKVLEEPPEHVIFIMATTEPNKVIPTIMSRCQRFDFYPIPVDKIRQRLSHVAEGENISISEPAINIIAKYADGSVRDADGILEQLSSCSDDNIGVKEVISLLGVIDYDILFEFSDILIEKNTEQALLFARRMVTGNHDLREFILEFLEHLYNLYVLKKYNEPFNILDLNTDYKDKYLRQAELFGEDRLKSLIDLFSSLYKQVRFDEGIKTIFKVAVIQAVNKESSSANTSRKNSGHIKEKEKPGAPDIAKAKKNNDRVEISVKQKEEEVLTVEKKKDEEVLTTAKQKDEEAVTDIKKEDGKKAKKPVRDGSKESIILNNFEQIKESIKKNKMPVYAMFVETVGYHVEDKKLVFYLVENRKWHKDRLNKDTNIKFITDMIKEITGVKYIITFKLFNEKETDKNYFELNNENSFKVEEQEAVNPGDGGDDILKYFEKKFGIEE